MMKINFFRTCVCSLFVMSAMGFVSCSDDDGGLISKAGHAGEIQVDRQRIGTCQPFTLSCNVFPGENMKQENWMWNDGVLNHDAVMEGNKAVHSAYVKEAGTTQFKLVYHGIGCDDKVYEAQKEILFEVVPTDVRNSFWHESVHETLRNIKYYGIEGRVKDNQIIFQEKDVVLHTDLKEMRSVLYNFENEKLQDVYYQIDLSSYDDVKVMGSLRLRLGELTKHQGYDQPLDFSYRVNEGKSLTEEEKHLAEAFVQGAALEKFDEQGVLGKAVKDGKLMLLVKGMNDKSIVQFVLSYHKGLAKPLLQQVFNPAR